MIAGGDGGGQAQCGRHPSPAPNRHQVRPPLGNAFADQVLRPVCRGRCRSRMGAKICDVTVSDWTGLWRLGLFLYVQDASLLFY